MSEGFSRDFKWERRKRKMAPLYILWKEGENAVASGSRRCGDVAVGGVISGFIFNLIKIY